MTWTAAVTTKNELVFYLGYSLSQADLDYVESAMDTIAAIADEDDATAAVALIEGTLAELGTIVTGINTERDVEGSTKLSVLRYEARRHVVIVSTLMSLEVRSDVFSSGGAAT